LLFAKRFNAIDVIMASSDKQTYGYTVSVGGRGRKFPSFAWSKLFWTPSVLLCTKDTTAVAVPLLDALQLLSFSVYALFYLAYAWFDVCTALAIAC